jgi:hypothetical protein
MTTRDASTAFPAVAAGADRLQIEQEGEKEGRPDEFDYLGGRLGLL